MDVKEIIAARAALEMQDGDVCNLGIGMPTLIVNYIPEDVHIVLQSENGMLGMGGAPTPEENSGYIVNAGGASVTVKEEGCFFDSATSFGIIRGGHVDITILGALQVDAQGSLASHIIPGKMVPGMGGAMDLVVGAKKVVVVTTHTAKGNAPKILQKCTLPLTAFGKVSRIITELAVMDICERGIVLREIHKDTTIDYVKSVTEAELIVEDSVGTFG